MSIPNHTNLKFIPHPNEQEHPLSQGQSDGLAIEEFKQKWLKMGNELPQSHKEHFNAQIQKMAHSMILNLAKISVASPAEKERKLRALIQLHNYSAKSFYNSFSKYVEEKKEVHSEFDSLHQNIQNARVNFNSLEPDSFDQNESELKHHLRDAIHGKIAHDLHHDGRKTSAFFYEFGSHLPYSVSENSNNPNRDQIINAFSHIAVDMAVKKILPKCLPGYAVISGSHVIAEGSRILERHLESIAKDADIAKMWDIQYHSTGEGLDYNTMILYNRITLKALQFPSHILNNITEAVKKTLVSSCNHVGLTEDNIAKITKEVIDTMVNNPELYSSFPF